ncbi:MAG: hypothetical protein RIF46_03505 [Cyclobacteriaceae bacterium]
MALNHTVFSKYIKNSDKNSFGTATYDLRVGKIIDMDGNEHVDSVSIPSQGMVVVISKETVKIPETKLGYATVKTRLAQEGIMTNNIGIIDPGYEGLLSSVIINFGVEPYSVRINDSFLRLSFHDIEGLDPKDDIIPLKYDVPIVDYVKRRKEQARDKLGVNFMNYQNWVDRASADVYRRIRRNFGLIFGSLITIATVFGGVYTYRQVVLVEKKENELISLKNSFEARMFNLEKKVNDDLVDEDLIKALQSEIMRLKQDKDSLIRISKPKNKK